MNTLTASSELTVISPHLDDAIFSLGGFLNGISASTRIRVINVFSRTGFVFEKIQSADEGSEIRKAEDRLALNTAGVTDIHNLDFPEALERGYEREEIFLDGNEMSTEVELCLQIQERIKEITLTNGPILVPAGFGGHVDHLLAREVAKNDERVMFYAELPYVARDKRRTAAEKFLAGKTREQVRTSPSQIDDHISLCRLYVSQIQERHLDEMKILLEISGYQFWQ